MAGILTFLATHREGIWVLVTSALGLCAAAQWACWVFGWGRFGRERSPGSKPLNPLRYVMADLLVQIVNDFRHLLALVVVSMFALALFVAMVPGLTGGNMDHVKDAVQVVASSLAGLIGSIIGYYFGESAAQRERTPRMPDESGGAPVQETGSPADIHPAQTPAGVERPGA